MNTGEIAEKPDYELEFEPLWNEKESERATIEHTNAQADLKPFITYNVLDKLVQAVFDGIERYAKKQVEKKATEKKDENS